MADLNTLEASTSTKIVGSDSTGVESNFVNATANGELLSADILSVSVVQTTLSIGTSTAVEAKVGSTNLSNRKSILIQAQGTNLNYGFSSSSQPFTIANGASITLSLGSGVSVWLKRSSGTGTISVALAEFA